MRNGRLFDFLPDWLTEYLAECAARRKAFSPVGARVRVIFDDTRDPAIAGYGALGTVSACSMDQVRGIPRDVLVQLDHNMMCTFDGRSCRFSIRSLVLRPCLRWRTTSRLAVGEWAAVRIIDAPSMYHADYDATMGTGRLYLHTADGR